MRNIAYCEILWNIATYCDILWNIAYCKILRNIAKYSDITFEWYGLLNDKNILNWEIVWEKDTFYEYITTNLKIHLEYIYNKQVVNKSELNKITHVFESHKETINNTKSHLVHHDLADHNLMYNTQSKWLGAIFDWEAMVLWDPMLDLWSCVTWETHYFRKTQLIAWYKSIKKLPQDYELRMDLYELRTWIWKIMFIIRMGFCDQILKRSIISMKEVLSKFN